MIYPPTYQHGPAGYDLPRFRCPGPVSPAAPEALLLLGTKVPSEACIFGVFL